MDTVITNNPNISFKPQTSFPMSVKITLTGTAELFYRGEPSPKNPSLEDVRKHVHRIISDNYQNDVADWIKDWHLEENTQISIDNLPLRETSSFNELTNNSQRLFSVIVTNEIKVSVDTIFASNQPRSLTEAYEYLKPQKEDFLQEELWNVASEAGLFSKVKVYSAVPKKKTERRALIEKHNLAFAY
jgi:hypothetical protein